MHLCLRLSRRGRFAYTPARVALVRDHPDRLSRRLHPLEVKYHQFRVVEKMANPSSEMEPSPKEVDRTRHELVRVAHGILRLSSLQRSRDVCRGLSVSAARLDRSYVQHEVYHPCSSVLRGRCRAEGVRDADLMFL